MVRTEPALAVLTRVFLTLAMITVLAVFAWLVVGTLVLMALAGIQYLADHLG